MARRKTKRPRTKRRKARTRTSITAVWKSLILFNLLISAFGFWLIYSQNNYMLEMIESNLPVSIYAPYKTTSVVVNPLTGQFMIVNSVTLAGMFLAIAALMGMYFLLQERL